MAEPTLYKNAAIFWSSSTCAVATDQIPGVKAMEFPMSKAELANSVMGDGAETFFPGLISAPVSVTCRQDFTTGATLGDGGVDKEAWTRWNGDIRFKMKFRAVNAAVSSTNPSYILSRVGVFSHTPFGAGTHGQLLENKLEMRLLSGCTVSRSTTT